MMSKPTAPSLRSRAQRWTAWQRQGVTVGVCFLTTALLLPFPDTLDRANIIMVFLLVVLGVSVTLGRSSAVLAAVLSVLLFDVAFVPPRFSLSVNDPQYLLTFAVMLLVALTTARLASGLQLAAERAQQREQRTQALYALAHALSGELTQAGALARIQDFVSAQMPVRVAPVLALDGQPITESVQGGLHIEPHLATLAMAQSRVVSSQAMQSPGWASIYIALQGATTVRGVLAVGWNEPEGALATQDLALLEAVASLLAITLERLHYVEVAHASQLGEASERLRSAILSALSHDLRTPLTVLVGLADALQGLKPPLSVNAREMTEAIHRQALQLSHLVVNLLEMARWSAGQVRPRLEWHAWAEVIEASLRHLGEALAGHAVSVQVSATLPLVEMDAVLMERVVSNLLENAAKYAPEGSRITVSVRECDTAVVLSVEDEGPGFDPQRIEAMFDLFARGERESSVRGFGLGLAICRHIVEAHGGRITAHNRSGGGACLEVSLPKGTPPDIAEEL